MLKTFPDLSSLEQVAATLPEEMIEQIITNLDEELALLQWSWDWTARADQLAATDDTSRIVGIIAGRGGGKTRTGGEWVRRRVGRGFKARFAFVGRTAADVRDTMVAGESGILSVFPPSEMPKYTPTARRVDFVDGSEALCFTAEVPGQLRGPQFHYCFPAGTAVETADGSVPIEMVPRGTSVWTRHGLRQVTETGSRWCATMTVRHERGSLTGTPDHPVWTQNRGWVELQNLEPGDKLFSWASGSSTGDASSGTIGRAASGRSSSGRAGSGSSTTVRSRPGSRSTTTTKTRRTTGSRTWSRLRRALTRWRTRLSGLRTSARTAVSTTKRAPGAADSSPSGATHVGPGWPSGPASPDPLRARSAVSSSSAVRGGSSAVLAAPTGRGPVVRVYNLSVEEHPEFFADGVLVHNSWADELAAWDLRPDDSGTNAWDNLQFATRLGRKQGVKSQVLFTTTPKRIKMLRELLAKARVDREIAIYNQASTFDNIHNLDPEAVRFLMDLYEGTALADQELKGVLSDEVEGAMMTEDEIEVNRLERGYNLGKLPIRVVGVDPSTADNPTDECGIVVVGAAPKSSPVLRRTGYVLEDASMYGAPKKWARRVVEMALKWDAVVRAEQNQGGAMVREVIHGINPEIRVELVTATVSKFARAEPVAMAHQQGRVKWAGRFAELEDQWTTWVPIDNRKDESPDRIDAMVHAFTGVVSLAKKSTRSGGRASSSNPARGRTLDIRTSSGGGRARR